MQPTFSLCGALRWDSIVLRCSRDNTRIQTSAWLAAIRSREVFSSELGHRCGWRLLQQLGKCSQNTRDRVDFSQRSDKIAEKPSVNRCGEWTHHVFNTINPKMLRLSVVKLWMITGTGLLELLLKQCICSEFTSLRPGSPFPQVWYAFAFPYGLLCIIMCLFWKT